MRYDLYFCCTQYFQTSLNYSLINEILQSLQMNPLTLKSLKGQDYIDSYIDIKADSYIV